MNGKVDGGDGSLKSFYGYKETFGRGSVWVDVPQNLTFVHTNNPYEDEEGELFAASPQTPHAQNGGGGRALPHGQQRQQSQQSQQWDYEGAGDAYGSGNGGDAWGQNQQMYATHGLEALSAVASQDQYSYAPPPAPMSMHTERPPSQHSHPSTSPQQNNATSSQGLDFILNPPSMNHDASSNIDPQLSSETPDQKPPPPQFSSQHQQQQHPQQQEPPQSPGNVRTHPLQPIKPPYLPIQGHHRVDSTSRAPSIEDPELCFLLRDYSERAGLWMDLFDLGLFFSTQVPVWAVSCPLLLYSSVALSAKSLSRVDGRKPIMRGQVSPSRQSKMERWPGLPMDAEGWLRKGRVYYDIAVTLLRQSLSGASRPSTSSLPSDATLLTISTVQGLSLPAPDSDELVAATAILCVYEFLDASGAEWSRHLDGAKSLFEIAKDRMMPLTLPPSPGSLARQVNRQLAGHIDPGRSISNARVAIFWNFARQDMLSAFINNTNTRLDTSDLKMWRGGGLKLTPEGFVCNSNPKHPDYRPEHAMTDDTISNALIWLTMKLVNFIAAGDSAPDAMSPFGLGVRQRELLSYWEGLDEQFRVWYEGLPESFHAAACRRPSLPTLDESTSTSTNDRPRSRHSPSSFAPASEKWFPRPMCASTMQHYHFARIQLLHNKPELSTATPMAPSPAPSSSSAARRRASSTIPASLSSAPGSSLAARHATYAAILQQSRHHAREIVAIGLGRMDEGARVHSVQPLWTAGLVLGGSGGGGGGSEGAEGGGAVGAETRYWRATILGLLRGVERDMGWACGYRVRGLGEVWGVREE